MLRATIIVLAFAGVLAPGLVLAGGAGPISTFIGDGPGFRHDQAPPELEQFGQLAGVWNVTVEMRAQDGGWVPSAPGVWAWKYAIGGFAVQDLWYQGADNLPAYMAQLGRDYLLTANRIFDVTTRQWQIAWMANGAGEAMGSDYGTFTAVYEDGEIVMSSPQDDRAVGLQRVRFFDITPHSFEWQSEYSRDDGKNWLAVMRLHATRRK